MNYTTEIIKNGILRIRAAERKTTAYMERYGILAVPERKPCADVTVSDREIRFPNGRALCFSVRPAMDDAFWQDESAYLTHLFREKIPQVRRVIGAPADAPAPSVEELERQSGKARFGIRFEIAEGERFYGLGEGDSESIEHRGKSFQNWAVYQYNEIPIPLVLCSGNWGILIAAQDRHFVDIDDHDKGHLTILGNNDDLDIFVLWGDSMKDLLRHYTELTGRSMVLPKWGYGLTYIAPIHQNQWELMHDMERFREMHIPCDNVSLEPGWMTRFYDYSFDKQWNLEKFHMDSWMRSRDYPYTFISALRRMGLHTALWFCENYDFCDEEERQVTGKGKLTAWYDHMKQFVNDGVDGFKLDPADTLIRISPDKVYTNGESELAMHNLSQVLLPKQVRLGFEKQMGLRPFLHYCGGYIGQQKWSAATTGDNDGGTRSMIWLLNLAMSGFMNTTVDMDVFDVRAIHYAMLAPWAHHNAWMGVGQPWYAGEECEKAYIDYARLRYRLLPYLYSAALECHESGVPMLRTMALEFQNDPECAMLSKQYMIGDALLVSAYADSVYLPAGKWIDFWTGTVYDGGQTLDPYTPPKGRGGALFVRGGAILPEWCERDYTTQYSDEEIELHIYPNGESRTVFYEDDGVSLQYLTAKPCRTEIVCLETEDSVTVTVGAREGDYTGKPERRTWKVTVHGCNKPLKLICNGENDCAVPAGEDH